jgi:hypothetical protein
VTWPEASAAIAGIVGGLIAIGGVGFRLVKAWTLKAMALGAAAEVEKQKVNEIAELRKSHAKFMERMQAAEDEIRDIKRTEQLRRQIRRDTGGIPRPDDDDGR